MTPSGLALLLLPILASLVGPPAQDAALPPPVQEPITPYRGYWPDSPQAWDQTFANLKAEAAKGGKDVVFLGDSITQGWGEAGKAAWEREFAPLRAINLGIGGDQTSQLLYRLDHGQLDGLDPKLFVLNIGVNNLWAGELPPERIAAGISAVVATLRERAPRARILLIGILPTGAEPTNPLRERVRRINALMKERSDANRVTYVDLAGAFLDGEGRLPAEAMPDALHPNAKGYEAYAAALAPLVRAELARKR